MLPLFSVGWRKGTAEWEGFLSVVENVTQIMDNIMIGLRVYKIKDWSTYIIEQYYKEY